MKRFAIAVTAGMLSLQAASAWAAPRVHVLILDGESAAQYHNWAAITPILKKELDETGLFDTEVLTAPTKDEDFSHFHPAWSKYQVVVLNYDAPDERWSDDVRNSFETYMKNGGGLVTVHAADNAFPHWKAFNEMIGVGGWRGRDEKSGPHWYYQNGKLVSDDKPGKAGMHGPRVPFAVTLQDTTNPIVKGLPKTWMHQGDELYANLRGPGGMTVLATAYSDPMNRGTGFDEPMVMVSHFGKGRVVHSAWGHDGVAQSSVDAVVIFQRGVEWAATGRVTQPVPSSFPTANTVSYRTDLEAMDPNAKKGLNPLDLVQQSAPARLTAPPAAAPGTRPTAPAQ